MVYPHIRPPALLAEADSITAANSPRPPRVEYLATLSRHSAAVNVVRFSPNGKSSSCRKLYLSSLNKAILLRLLEMVNNICLRASGADITYSDGMVIIWAPSTNPPPATYGSDISPDDLQHEKEYWKPRTTFRYVGVRRDLFLSALTTSHSAAPLCRFMTLLGALLESISLPEAQTIRHEYSQPQKVCWNAHVAIVMASSCPVQGKCVYEIAEHSHYVQGVAWDPLNEYIATQSSDRSMHIYRISTRPGGTLEVHAVGKNTRMPHRNSHSRTPSGHGNNGNTSRPRMRRRESIASDMESNSALDPDEGQTTTSGAPLTPALSVTNMPAFAVPPPPMEAHSRRSSFSSNAPGSPTTFNNSRYGRSPSPMPPLPAIRSLPSPTSAALWASVRLYGDESYSNFFRRLTFSPDGGLLLTPAGQFEDPSVNPHSAKSGNTTPTRGRKGHPSETGLSLASNSTSSVYIYSRANFARPPIAQLPGHQKASVAVRFSPILYELRPGVLPPANASSSRQEDKEHQNDSKKDAPPTAVLEQSLDGSMDVDVIGPVSIGRPSQPLSTTLLTPQKTPIQHTVSPQPRIATSNLVAPSPTLSPLDLRPPTPVSSKPSTPVPSQPPSSQTYRQTPSAYAGSNLQTGSVFALPYRLLYAVVTMDTVAIYDTQQAGPICLLTKLHYDEFTDLSW